MVRGSEGESNRGTVLAYRILFGAVLCCSEGDAVFLVLLLIQLTIGVAIKQLRETDLVVLLVQTNSDALLFSQLSQRRTFVTPVVLNFHVTPITEAVLFSMLD